MKPRLIHRIRPTLPMWTVEPWVIWLAAYLIAALALAGIILAVTTAASAQEAGTLGSLNRATPDYRAGFITGYFQGMPLRCPGFMSGRTLRDALDGVLRSGRATGDMGSVEVLYQLMREGGCTLDPTLLESLERRIQQDGPKAQRGGNT